MQYGLQQRDIELIQSVFASFQEVEKAILYGSRAKGNFKPASDIDISFHGSELTQTIINQIAWQLDDLLLPYTFDLSIYFQIKNNDLIEHINRVGVELYIKHA